MSSSTVERLVIHCASTARLSGDAARVSQAACSAAASSGQSRIELDDAPGRHRAEPLADVALVEAGRVGELLARRAGPCSRSRRAGPCDGRRRPSPQAPRCSAGRACARRTPRRALRRTSSTSRSASSVSVGATGRRYVERAGQLAGRRSAGSPRATTSPAIS